MVQDTLIKINNEVNTLGMGCLFPIPDAAFHGKYALSV